MNIKQFNNVIIWGYPYGTHTQSFVWHGFYRAFKSLGIETYWIANGWSFENLPANIDISNSLFLFEKNDVSGMPISAGSTYLFHMMGNRPETDASHNFLGKVKRLVDWRQHSMNHWDDVHYKYTIKRAEVQEIDRGFLFEKSPDGVDKIYCAWATDLLPNEIDLNDMHAQRERISWYVGTVGGGRGGLDDCLPTIEIYDNRKLLREFRTSCQENGIEFKVNCPWLNPLSQEEARKLIKSSFLTVDSRHPSMLDWGYIPCRIMKNISYGQLGLTNSRAVHDFLDGEILSRNDGRELFDAGLSHQNDFEMIRRQMILIREKHTYVNRVKSMLKSLEM